MHRACPHPQAAVNPLVTREHVLTTPAQTEITGGKPVRRYKYTASMLNAYCVLRVLVAISVA